MYQKMIKNTSSQFKMAPNKVYLPQQRLAVCRPDCGWIGCCLQCFLIEFHKAAL